MVQRVGYLAVCAAIAGASALALSVVSGCSCGKKGKQPEPPAAISEKPAEPAKVPLVDKPVTNIIQRMESPVYKEMLKGVSGKRSELNVRMSQTLAELRTRRSEILKTSLEAEKISEEISDLREKVSEREAALEEVVMKDNEYRKLKETEAREQDELRQISLEAQRLVQAGMRAADDANVKKPPKRNWTANTNGLVLLPVDTNAVEAARNARIPPVKAKNGESAADDAEKEGAAE